MNIETNRLIKVFAKDGQYGKMYSTSISSKKQDGSYQTSYIQLRFRKDVTLDNETMIEIKSAWLMPTNDINKVAVFVNEFNTQEQVVETAHKEYTDAEVIKAALDEDTSFNPNDCEILTDDDLPF